ncbi:MAG: glycosyltransferase family 2 protein [Candidatus Hydrogenedentes bacterium]|nr:glycosyltransferase family 2 protein [Candidatus Hydrogenedentota bacterium]
MPTASRPLVYVIVVNWNGREHLEACFASLLDSSYPNARFLLVDNASEDGSADYVRERFGEDERIEILELPRNEGWSPGNNAGLEHARLRNADYALLLNNDTAVEAQAIEYLVEYAEFHPRTGILAPKLLLYDHPEIVNSVGLEASLIGAAWDIGIGRLDGPRWNEEGPVLGACGAGMFVRMEATEKTGLLSTDFEIYLDDLDLCLRMWNAGYEVHCCPKARIRHKFSATMGEEKHKRRKYYLNTRNRARLIMRNYPVSQFPRIEIAYDVGEARAIGRALLNGEFWKIRAHIRSWASALLYAPSGIRERIDRRRKALHRCRFWPFIRTDLMFFPGTEFPRDGWYTAIETGGEQVRPFTSRARIRHPGGRLRVVQMNCYPQLGAFEIDLLHEGQRIDTLTATGREETVYDLSQGTVEFVAKRIFSAEETGEAVDLGGWIGLERFESEKPR